MPKVKFVVFFMVYAEYLGWEVPDFHLWVCEFLENYGPLGLLMMPRGHGKSTFLDIYNAWRFYCNPEHLLLHQGATDKDAAKVSRGTEQVLERHPLCVMFGFKKERGELQKWWVVGSTDVRHGSIHARGVLSNVTGARANEIQNDDVEMPSNIGTPEAREKLRYRLSEQTHILIPGGQKLYVGTPHTHDSLYTQVQKLGAKTLILKMFQNEARFEKCSEAIVNFEPINVFSGIGVHAKYLKPDEDYKYVKQGNAYKVIFVEEHGLVDVYGEALWPKRFTPAVMQERRKECRTLNEWDSQYQLHAKPIGEVRLDPDKLIAYDCEPIIKTANKHMIMMLGDRRIVSASCRVDPSSGKTKSDISAVALILQDEFGVQYWHRSKALKGAISEHDDKGKINGGQVWQLCDLIKKYKLTRVTVETNGIGGFFPTVLKNCLKVRKLRCGVTEIHSTGQKNKRILGALEGPLNSGVLWAHISVLEDENGDDSVEAKQMRMFNAAVTDQDDDYIDALAGAVSDEPIRIGKTHNTVEYGTYQTWRENSGVYEATVDFDD